MPLPTRAAASPMTRAHKNCAPLGRAKAGRFGTASEIVPTPVSDPMPMNTSAPMPAASSPGSSTIVAAASAEPDRLHQQERSEQGRTQQGGDSGEAAGGADHGDRLGGRVALDESDHQCREATAQRDERRLRTDDGAQPQ